MEQGAYDFQKIEKRWREHWLKEKTFRTPGPGNPDFDPEKPKFYVLDMFPYTSGSGLHIGHPKGYIATDIYSRFKRMCGYNVLHPMGFDSFGLPAEQYAIQHNEHPAVITKKSIETMREQFEFLGMSYDWDRELATSGVGYYQWTQWIFLQLFHSWFDPQREWVDEAGRKLKGRAVPISDLVAQFESGARTLGKHELAAANADGGVTWKDLTSVQRFAVLNGYRLAYHEDAVVNWCPGLGTVLANEEITSEGMSELGNFPVYRRPLRQWMMRISAFADRLLEDLDAPDLPDGKDTTYTLDWPEAVRRMQRNWIGRSEGTDVTFEVLVPGTERVATELNVFTTRPDTLFGATFMVVAPQHPLVNANAPEYLVPEDWPDEAPRSWKGPDPTMNIRDAVSNYVKVAEARVSNREDAKGKTGLFSGIYARNPVNGQKLPLFVSDYVSMEYGSGAIMAVPAHDERDFEFAAQYELEIVRVVEPPGGRQEDCFTGDGTSIHSPAYDGANPFFINGLATPRAKQTMTQALEKAGRGKSSVNYRLRDWIFSRQRYWGEPFPLASSREGDVISVSPPVALPDLEDFSPEASDDPNAPIKLPLARADEEWRKVDIDGKEYERETNVMPQWAGSCWYYLRFIDPNNPDAFCDTEKEKYFMPVDLYVGGAEHAVLHLLYARFWHKALYDLGHVSSPEPFKRLFNQGMITADAFADDRGVYVDIREVEIRDDEGYHRKTGEKLRKLPGKMGKRYKNGLPPEEVGDEFGVDSLRLYESYMGPLDASTPWSMSGIRGMQRFLQRVWRNYMTPQRSANIGGKLTPELEKLRHKTIIRVTEDIEALRLNTAIAALIELNNALVGLSSVPRPLARDFLLLLSPFAPHLAEEIWEIAGLGDKEISREDWPTGVERLAAEQTVEMPVQVNGKVRARFDVEVDSSEETVERLALEQTNVQAHLKGQTPRKVIVVPNRLVNIVV